MRKFSYIIILMFCIVFVFGCSARKSIVDFVKEGGLETKGLVNLASANSGAMVSVSQENPDRPASILIDGITSSDNWDQGEGWEVQYEGFYARGEYVGYGVEDPVVVMEQMRNRNDDQNDQSQIDANNPSWRGLRTQTRYGNVDTAMGWIVVDFPDEKTINRAVVYTVDSKKYPASKFGVSDLTLQYWSDSAKSWALVEMLGKGKGKATNSIQDNEKGIINLRFQPIRTQRVRFIIKWTNDSKSVRRGYYQYTLGTIRIAEIEVYGYEKADTTEFEQAKVVSSIRDANAVAEIQTIIDNYIDGYNKKDVNMAMASISPRYLRNGEVASDLKNRLEAIFSQYQNLNIKLSNIQIKVDINDATATAKYSSQQDLNISSGNIVFMLSKDSGYWKITSMDLQ